MFYCGLAELLIVVAIIAVLVAISIPIFGAQLEKAREATDAANIRSAYAEVVAAQLTGATADTGNVKVAETSSGSGIYNYTATVKATQKDGSTWAGTDYSTTGTAKIGGQSVAASTDGWKITASSNSDTVSITVGTTWL